MIGWHWHLEKGWGDVSEYVWVVEQGSYSDYRVVGVYTSRKAAKTVAEKINAADDWGEATVDKWPLNPGADAINEGREPYMIQMLRDGTVEEVKTGRWSGYNMCGSLQIWRRSKAPAYKGKGVPDCLRGTVFARDPEHAIKIANEQRTQLIAANKW